MKYISQAIIILILLCSTVYAGDADTGSVEKFFNKYVEVSDAFDVNVVDFISDEAIIRNHRRYPHGLERTMEVTGRDWKELIKKAMPFAKMRGDRSEFSDIEIKVDGNRAKIKANRYSFVKCYTDTGYYMIVERQEDGSYLIVEEYIETQPQSNCGQ